MPNLHRRRDKKSFVGPGGLNSSFESLSSIVIKQQNVMSLRFLHTKACLWKIKRVLYAHKRILITRQQQEAAANETHSQCAK